MPKQLPIASNFRFNNIAGIALGGHVRAVFTLVTVIFIVCVTVTVTSFAELPLKLDALAPKSHDFSNEDEEETMRPSNSHETAGEALSSGEVDKIAKTTSYGTLPKDETLSVPKSVRSIPSSLIY